MHVRMSFFLVWSILTVPAVAFASALPRLVVTRSAEATDCPDAPALAQIVEQKMQRPALDASPDGAGVSLYEVTIDRSKDGYSAMIRAGDLTRELSDPGSTCSELADALALTLAIMLDSEPEVAPAKPPEPAPSPAPKVPTPPNISVRVILPEVRRWSGGVAGSFGETIGFLAPLSFVLWPEGWIRYRSATFGAGAFLIPWSTAGADSSPTVRMRLFTGTLQGCGRIGGKPTGLRVDLCGQTYLGAVSGEGVGFAVNRGDTRPWWALGLTGMLEGNISSSLDWSLRLGFAVPIITQRFTGTRTEGTGASVSEVPVTLFEPPKFAGFLAFGVRWSIL